MPKAWVEGCNFTIPRFKLYYIKSQNSYNQIKDFGKVLRLFDAYNFPMLHLHKHALDMYIYSSCVSEMKYYISSRVHNLYDELDITFVSSWVHLIWDAKSIYFCDIVHVLWLTTPYATMWTVHWTMHSCAYTIVNNSKVDKFIFTDLMT